MRSRAPERPMDSRLVRNEPSHKRVCPLNYVNLQSIHMDSSRVRGLHLADMLHAPKRPMDLSAFRTRGVPGPTSKLSPRAPAQMGRRETELEGGKKPEGDRRKRGNPRPSCLSQAQVGCGCSRGLQASTREGARGLRERRPVLPRAANPL
jgi:hypothetical protein